MTDERTVTVNNTNPWWKTLTEIRKEAFVAGLWPTEWETRTLHLIMKQSWFKKVKNNEHTNASIGCE
jgi:hypothetical protein